MRSLMHSNLVHTIYNGGFLLFRLKAGLYLPNKFTCSFIDLWIIVSQRIIYMFGMLAGSRSLHLDL